jgi:hypothetical protein
MHVKPIFKIMKFSTLAVIFAFSVAAATANLIQEGHGLKIRDDVVANEPSLTKTDITAADGSGVSNVTSNSTPQQAGVPNEDAVTPKSATDTSMQHTNSSTQDEVSGSNAAIEALPENASYATLIGSLMVHDALMQKYGSEQGIEAALASISDPSSEAMEKFITQAMEGYKPSTVTPNISRRDVTINGVNGQRLYRRRCCQRLVNFFRYTLPTVLEKVGVALLKGILSAGR